MISSLKALWITTGCASRIDGRRLARFVRHLPRMPKVYAPDVLVMGGNPLLNALCLLRLQDLDLSVMYWPTGADVTWPYALMENPLYRAYLAHWDPRLAGIGSNQDGYQGIFQAVAPANTRHCAVQRVPRGLEPEVFMRRPTNRVIVYASQAAERGTADELPRMLRMADAGMHRAEAMMPSVARHAGRPIGFGIAPGHLILTSQIAGIANKSLAAGSTVFEYDTSDVMALGSASASPWRTDEAIRGAVADVVKISHIVEFLSTKFNR